MTPESYHSSDFSVSANPQSDSTERRYAALHIAHHVFDLTMTMTFAEIVALHHDDFISPENTLWKPLGMVGAVPAHWSITSGSLALLVGESDEDWSTGFRLPLEMLDEIRRVLFEMVPWLRGLSPPPGFAGHDPEHYQTISLEDPLS